MHLCCIKQGRNVIKRTQTLLHAIAQHSRVQKQGFFSDSSKHPMWNICNMSLLSLIREDRNVTQTYFSVMIILTVLLIQRHQNKLLFLCSVRIRPILCARGGDNWACSSSEDHGGKCF